MERIIIGVDTRHESQPAIDWAIRRADRTRLGVTLVTAFDSLIDDPAKARQRLIALAERITAAGTVASVEIELANASIHQALEDRSRQADLVVIGSHRTRPVRSLLAGGLPTRVSAHAHCPVVLVNDDWIPRDGSVVVGLGSDETSEPALRFAAEEALRRSTSLELVHAWQITPGEAMASAALIVAPDGFIRGAHRAQLDDASRALRREFPNLPIVDILAQVPTADALIEASASAELVVIGTHHHEAEIGLLVGSVGGRLLRRLRVPVCVVPGRSPRDLRLSPAIPVRESVES